MKPIISIEEVTFSYPEKDPVLKNINLKIYPGEFIVILGPNGSAKTTLLKLILGFIRPQKGYIYIEQKKGTVPDIGYVPQKTPFFNAGFPATVSEILNLEISSHTNKNEKRLLLSQTLQKLSLEDKKGALLKTLSGGQLQRTLIGRALINKPKILILDEPMSGLDLKSQEEFINLLLQLQNEGLTIVMVTHDVTPLLKKASCFVVLANGCISKLTSEQLKVV